MNTASHEITGSLTAQAHLLVRDHITPGDTAIDATLGNGHDTLFLARCVGKTGTVIGFDIQTQAITSTRQLLEREGATGKNIHLHAIGHEHMAATVHQPVAAVMFNLGYLPGSDKTTITRTSTTLAALQQALHLLQPGGCLSVICYPGHPGGQQEANAVTRWFQNPHHPLHPTTHYRRQNTRPTAPFLILAQAALGNEE